MSVSVVSRTASPALPELLDLVHRNDVAHVVVDADRDPLVGLLGAGALIAGDGRRVEAPERYQEARASLDPGEVEAYLDTSRWRAEVAGRGGAARRGRGLRRRARRGPRARGPAGRDRGGAPTPRARRRCTSPIARGR